MHKDKLWLFSFHFSGKSSKIKRAVLAHNPYEAASLLGGCFIERDGGICESSCDVHELGLCGTVQFPFEVFHEMDDEDIYLAGIFLDNNTHCHHLSGLLTRKGEARELFLKRQSIKIPDYIRV